MDTPNTYFISAEEFLNLANEAICHPEEDIVPYNVCHKSYDAIDNFLKGYLHSQNVSFSDKAKIQELLELCKENNAKFNELNLSLIEHRKETEDVWMNVERAEDYLSLAEKTKQIVLG